MKGNTFEKRGNKHLQLCRCAQTGLRCGCCPKWWLPSNRWLIMVHLMTISHRRNKNIHYKQNMFPVSTQYKEFSKVIEILDCFMRFMFYWWALNFYLQRIESITTIYWLYVFHKIIVILLKSLKQVTIN